jgi:hypothetical protein
MTGLAEAFRAYGAKGSNPRWSWSARTPDDQIVMTFWKDLIHSGGDHLSYSIFGRPDRIHWKANPGNSERIENLKWAKEHCDGLMRVVIVVAEDTEANPRKIVDSYPQKNWLMKLVELDEHTGEFNAISVPI